MKRSKKHIPASWNNPFSEYRHIAIDQKDGKRIFYLDGVKVVTRHLKNSISSVIKAPRKVLNLNDFTIHTWVREDLLSDFTIQRNPVDDGMVT